MRFDLNRMNQMIKIVETTVQNVGGVQKKVDKEIYSLYAFFDTVWAKDYQTAVSNNTQHQIRIVTRAVPNDIDTNKCSVIHNGKKYSIKQIMPDYQDSAYITIIAEKIG